MADIRPLEESSGWIFRDVRMELANDNALTAQSVVCVPFRPMKGETRTSSILTSRKIHPEDSSGGRISGGYPTSGERVLALGIWAEKNFPVSNFRAFAFIRHHCKGDMGRMKISFKMKYYVR